MEIEVLSIEKYRPEQSWRDGVPVVFGSCGKCLYWHRNSADTMECRRYPPQATNTGGFRFPDYLSSYDWCGEFKQPSPSPTVTPDNPGVQS